MKITRELVDRIHGLLDKGLVKGLGNPRPGEMCVEAAICYALGLPHGDDPKCVVDHLRMMKIAINDWPWSSNEARAAGLRRLAIAQLGSKGVVDPEELKVRMNALAIPLNETLRDILANGEEDASKTEPLVVKFAEDIVQILIDMKSPGAEWL